MASYGTPNTHNRSFFPAWPVIRGPAKYAADSTATPRELDDCHKASYGHPTLTPGIPHQRTAVVHEARQL